MLLNVKNLKTYYPIKKRAIGHNKYVKAVDGVSFSLNSGETLAIVGESGCGKSTLGKTILNLVPKTDGEIFLNGIEISSLKEKEFRKHRKDMQMIFQDPINSLNPRMTLLKTIVEPLKIYNKESSNKELEERAVDLLKLVGIPKDAVNRLPHQFSGGQCQRVAIARALAVEPKLIIADEPVSALDVSIQAQILNLMYDLQKSRGLSYIFISHDLSVVSHISDKIIVMNNGKIVEMGTTEEVIKRPKELYTKSLLDSIPKINF